MEGTIQPCCLSTPATSGIVECLHLDRSDWELSFASPVPIGRVQENPVETEILAQGF